MLNSRARPRSLKYKAIKGKRTTQKARTFYLKKGKRKASFVPKNPGQNLPFWRISLAVSQGAHSLAAAWNIYFLDFNRQSKPVYASPRQMIPAKGLPTTKYHLPGQSTIL
jgi:hypothetical protein